MEAIFKIIKFAYASILRKLVKEAIDNPDSDIDDFVLRLLDNLFEYSE